MVRKRLNSFAYTITSLMCAAVILASCGDDGPNPLPMGYFRIDIPEPEYTPKDLDCPFGFEVSKESRLEFYKSGKSGEKCWFDISYPRYKARLHFTHKEMQPDELRSFIEDSRSMTYEHHVKASQINASVVDRSEEKVYGLVYELEGNVASPMQFYLTDSTSHFIRASLYFEAKPNQDSIRPVLNTVRKDMHHLISTFEWK